MPSKRELLERISRTQPHLEPEPKSQRWLNSSLVGAAPSVTVGFVLISALAAAVLSATGIPSGPGVPPPPNLQQVTAQAGFTPHLLPGQTPNYVGYLSSKSIKGPMAGVPGIVLVYSHAGPGLEIYEHGDPAPGTAIAGMTPLAPTQRRLQLGGRDCLVWLSPDGSTVTEFGFKTDDNLVIYVIPHTSLYLLSVASLVSDLA
jgi:hypothetical protein